MYSLGSSHLFLSYNILKVIVITAKPFQKVKMLIFICYSLFRNNHGATFPYYETSTVFLSVWPKCIVSTRRVYA